MILNLYAIKDELSEFASPITIKDDENAKRYFRHIVSENKMMRDNPEDFSIWHIGTFSTETGQIAFRQPEKLEGAKAFIREEKTND